jgi:hypothetical protein
MAQRYHIKPDGTVGVCKAEKGRCPYGGEESHYDSPEKAYEAFQNRMEQEYGTYRNNVISEAQRIPLSPQTIQSIDQYIDKMTDIKIIRRAAEEEFHNSPWQKRADERMTSTLSEAVDTHVRTDQAYPPHYPQSAPRATPTEYTGKAYSGGLGITKDHEYVPDGIPRNPNPQEKKLRYSEEDTSWKYVHGIESGDVQKNISNDLAAPVSMVKNKNDGSMELRVNMFEDSRYKTEEEVVAAVNKRFEGTSYRVQDYEMGTTDEFRYKDPGARYVFKITEHTD